MNAMLMILLVLATSTTASDEQPLGVVQAFLQAIEAGDGYRAVCYLSDDAILHSALVQQQLIAAGESAAMPMALIGMDGTPSDLLEWDGVDFTAHLLTSTTVKNMLADAEAGGGQAVSSSSAMVNIITKAPVTGAEQSIGVPMVLEGARWKMADIQGILVVISL